MSLLPLILGETSALIASTNAIKTGIGQMYEASPLGKLEGAFQGAENKLLNAPIHRAFQGQEGIPADFGSGPSGATQYSQMNASAPGTAGYVDAASAMQGLMSQAGIINSSSSQLQAGGGLAPLRPVIFNSGSLALNPAYLDSYQRNLEQIPEVLIEPDTLEKNEPVLFEANQLTSPGILVE